MNADKKTYQAGDIAGSSKAFESMVTPYLEMHGVMTAALFSTEGLLVASAGEREMDLEALGAYGASALSAAIDLADELCGQLPGTISLGLPGRRLILAPLGSDLFLLLVSEDNSDPA